VVQNSRSPQLALGALCAGMLMIVLDQTIVNVALPSIQHDLGFSQSSLAWVVNAYLIAFAGLLLLAGRLGDLIGRKRIFLSGLAVFIGASMLCGLAGSRNLSGANAVQALMIAGMLGMLFLGALYMQRILGYQPLEIGLAFLPAALLIATLSLRVAPRLNIRFGERAVLLTGLTIMTAGLAWLIRVPVDGTYVVDLLPSMILLGVGAGLSFPSLNTVAMADVAPSDSGLASGLVNTAGQLGGALGLAVLATVATSRTDKLLAAGANSVEALVSGFHLAFITSVALVAAGIVLGALVLRSDGMSEPAGLLVDEAERDEVA
jgi:MFS family permease